ncbi:hypothetical protein RUM43_004017 [Polyplax serrata]|uniref:Uncharacterized protein n=1 Tax=Polyplax serrata TaxID=468196 RepID=A0AAN8SAM1_POLSC
MAVQVLQNVKDEEQQSSKVLQSVEKNPLFLRLPKDQGMLHSQEILIKFNAEVEERIDKIEFLSMD